MERRLLILIAGLRRFALILIGLAAATAGISLLFTALGRWKADRAVSIGIIVNELVMNAVKYAYPDGPGPIHVELKAEGDELVLSIADNGVELALSLYLAAADGPEERRLRDEINVEVLRAAEQEGVGLTAAGPPPAAAAKAA